MTLKCGEDPYSTHYRSFHAFKFTLTTSNIILKGVYKTFKHHYYEEKVDISKFQVAHFIFELFLSYFEKIAHMSVV